MGKKLSTQRKIAVGVVATVLVAGTVFILNKTNVINFNLKDISLSTSNSNVKVIECTPEEYGQHDPYFKLVITPLEEFKDDLVFAPCAEGLHSKSVYEVKLNQKIEGSEHAMLHYRIFLNKDFNSFTEEEVARYVPVSWFSNANDQIYVLTCETLAPDYLTDKDMKYTEMYHSIYAKYYELNGCIQGVWEVENVLELEENPLNVDYIPENANEENNLTSEEIITDETTEDLNTETEEMSEQQLETIEENEVVDMPEEAVVEENTNIENN